MPVAAAILSLTTLGNLIEVRLGHEAKAVVPSWSMVSGSTTSVRPLHSIKPWSSMTRSDLGNLKFTVVWRKAAPFMVTTFGSSIRLSFTSLRNTDSISVTMFLPPLTVVSSGQWAKAELPRYVTLSLSSATVSLAQLSNTRFSMRTMRGGICTEGMGAYWKQPSLSMRRPAGSDSEGSADLRKA